LREIIVGTADSATASITVTSDEPMTEAHKEKIGTLARQAYPDSLIDEVNEDLDQFCHQIESFGAKVLRPNPEGVGQIFSTPNWSAASNNVYNMRDLHLVVGNTVIESPSPNKHRLFEAYALQDILYDYFEEGFRWINAPKQKLTGEYRIPFYEDGKRFTKLSEDEILFDAANTLRMGRDLIYLVSSSGNYKGAKWLQSVLGDDYNVHTTESIYRSSHIDSTLMVLKPGLVMLCGDRVDEGNCPKIFDSWDKIYFDDIVEIPVEEHKLHERIRLPVHKQLVDMGVWSDVLTTASDWIGMNFLSLDEETIMVDASQTPLIKVLEGLKFTVVPVIMRHAAIMKGGLHCTTLDTVRDSSLESYFE